MRFRIACVLASLVLASCTDAQDVTPTEAPSPASLPVAVVDGRALDAFSDDAEGDLQSWQGRPAIQSAIQAARAHWSAQDPGYEEEVRVLSVAEGAFTRPGVAEQAVLYLMARWPRCCPKVGLAIVEGDDLVRNVAFEGSTHGVGSVPDLDGDGIEEVALLSSFGMGGDEESSVVLLSLGDTLSGWAGAQVSASGCAAGREQETAFSVTAEPGDPPTFTSESFVRSCSGGAWEPGPGSEPLALHPVASETYTLLPVE